MVWLAPAINVKWKLYKNAVHKNLINTKNNSHSCRDRVNFITTCRQICSLANLIKIFCLSEYASVGYMAKRIQMRKNRFLAIQKMAEQKKNEALHASNANINNDSNNLDLGPKQTVSFCWILIWSHFSETSKTKFHIIWINVVLT